MTHDVKPWHELGLWISDWKCKIWL